LHRQALGWREHFFEALGYGGKGPGSDNSLGTNIGLAVLISLLLASVSIFHRALTRSQRQRLAVFVTLTFLILFIMSPQMPWGRVPSMLRYVQFPWRLLIFTAFFGSSAAAMAAPVINRWLHPLLLTGFAVLFAIPTLPMILSPPVIKQMSPSQLEGWIYRWERAGLYAGSLFQVFTSKWVQGDYRDPKFLAEHPVPKNRLSVISGDMVCNAYTHSGSTYQYRYNATVNSEARIDVFYWPGWELRVDGNRDLDGVRLGQDGLVQIRLPAGSHRAELHYNLSPEGKLARVVSSIAAIVCAAIFLLWIFSLWPNSWTKFASWQRRIPEPMTATGP